MKQNMLCLLLCLTLAGFVSDVYSKELVREFTGSGNSTTAEFEVAAPWVLDWRVSGEFTGSLAMQVDLIKSPGSEYVGKVVETKWVSDGVRLFDEGGRYRFKVSSTFANWTLRVVQLSREEAKAYTPK